MKTKKVKMLFDSLIFVTLDTWMNIINPFIYFNIRDTSYFDY